MLRNINLSRRVTKQAYKSQKEKLESRLIMLQRRTLDLGIPVIVVFEGWDAAGKGTLINELILPLDPRGFIVHSALPPNEEERLRPFLWRSWTRTPARGRWAIFDRSWYRRVLNERVDDEVKGVALAQAYEDIVSFERQLADDGNVIIKFLLHISKEEQKKRFDKLRKHRITAWRVTSEDRKRHRQYGKYLKAMDQMLAETDADVAPWTVVEAHDQRFATLQVFTTVIAALERRIDQVAREKRKHRTRKKRGAGANELDVSILGKVDLSLALEREDYRRKLKKKQERLRELEHEIYMSRTPVVIVYEGWDAAGKGGNVRRLTQKLDPRGYEVVPVGAPNDVERAHHYLWRFWLQMPKAGHITIFDRSWYGRVMVERVEEFCTETEWRRSYKQINEMEQHLTNFGVILLKFWLHIDPDEQLRRFQERQKTPYKRWKITEEDWRNREKWDAYRSAVEEMLFRACRMTN